MQIKHHLDGTERLREMYLYICKLSESDESFGSVKLNKLLFYSDFLAYLDMGKSLTGQQYQKLPQGPAPRMMKPMQDALISECEVALADRSYFGRTQKRPFALREPNLSLFSPEEIDHVNAVVRRYWGMSATAISEMSHRFKGWQVVAENETIPYESALLENRELTDTEKSWAQDIDMSGVMELLTGQHA